jgi:hypothetical protein
VSADSAGRIGYTLRVPVDPHVPRHEADIYLIQPARRLDTSDR